MSKRLWWILIVGSLALGVGGHVALFGVPTDGMTGEVSLQGHLFHLRYLAPPDSQWADGGVSIYSDILRVDTRSVALWISRAAQMDTWQPAAWQVGTQHSYTVIRRDNGETKVIPALLQYPALAALPRYLGLAAISALLILLAAISISRRLPDQPLVKPLTLLACGSLIGLSWFTFGNPFSYVALGWPFLAQNLLHMVANALIVGAWVHLALTFFTPLRWYSSHRRLTLAVVYGAYPVGLLILAALQSGLIDQLAVARAWEQQAAIGFKGAAYLAWGAQYRRATVTQRGQLHWVLATSVAYDLPFLIQAVSGEGGLLAAVQPWLALLPPLGYMMALLPGRALRIALQPTSGLIHGIANTLVVALFLSGFGLAASVLTRANQQDNLPMVTAALAVLLALMTAPLVNLVREQLDSWFKGTRGAQRALLYEFTGNVSNEISLGNVTAAFSQALEQGLQPEYAVLWLWDGETRTLYPVLTLGAPPRTPVVTSLDPSQQRQLSAQSTFTPVNEPWLTGFHGSLALVSSGELVGVCAVGLRIDGAPYSADAIHFFETLARSATLAFRNAQLISQLEDKVSALRLAYRQLMAAQESERRSLAAELHDETLQQLAHINLIAGSIQHAAGGQSADAQRLQQELQQELQQTITRTEQRLREILRGVHPAVLTNLGLISALEAWLPRPQNVKMALSAIGFDGRRLPDPDLEMALYRLAQESVHNALDHARASHIEVKLCWLDREVILEVTDDGIGFEPAVYLATMRHANGSTHFGLLNLHERVMALNGDLAIDSQPGHGTAIRARLPINSTN